MVNCFLRKNDYSALHNIFRLLVLFCLFFGYIPSHKQLLKLIQNLPGTYFLNFDVVNDKGRLRKIVYNFDVKKYRIYFVYE